MFRIDSSGNDNGKFTEGDPLAVPPRMPTVISADWLNSVQEEIASVIENAGVVLSKSDNSQLLFALVRLFFNTSVKAVDTGDLLEQITLNSIYAVSEGVTNSPFVSAGGWILAFKLGADNILLLAYSIDSPGVWIRQKISGSWQSAWFDIFGSTSPALNTVMRRDASGRSQVALPSVPSDIVNLEFLNNAGTPLSTAGSLMRRDGNGRAQVGNPAAGPDIVNLDFLNQTLAPFYAAYTNDNGTLLLSLSLPGANQTIVVPFTLLKPINAYLQVFAADFGAGSLTLNIQSKYRGAFVTLYSCVHTSTGVSGSYNKFTDGIMLNPGLYQLQLVSNNIKMAGYGYLYVTGYQNTSGNIKA